MNSTSRAFLVKLQKLEHQIRVAKLSEYSYPDSRDALTILDVRLRQREVQIEESEAFSEATRKSLLRDVNHLVRIFTALVGIIVRSASVRNAFELYAPFLQVCRATVGEDARLILSSEWEYVPFTYPQTLSALPNFIVIGLPASESDNVLVFPVAGHELGHTIWAKRKLSASVKSKVEALTAAAFADRRADLEKAFPSLKGADLDQDMFVQIIKSAVFNSATRQSEEVFCDFVGLILFGASYLFAYEYLLAPQISGARVLHYPDNRVRAEVLQKFAKSKLNIDLPDYGAGFLPDAELQLPQDQFICSVADHVVAQILEELFVHADATIPNEPTTRPSETSTSKVAKAFRDGVPHDGAVALGDLINAGWEVFRSDQSVDVTKQGRKMSDYVSDVVLKSAEISEIGRILA